MDIKNEAQFKRAVLEDDLVDLVYKYFNAFVMHGGTAVWRCYGGNRFSRDLDFYSNLPEAEESILQKRVHKVLVDSGYTIREEKYNNKTLTMHIIVKSNETTGKLDITFKIAEGRAVEYQRVDGTRRIIYALDPEAILNEKIETYLVKSEGRREEIHDLYDILVLKDRIAEPSKSTTRKLRNLISAIKGRPPENEKTLGTILLSGITPSFNEIINMLKEWSDAHD